VKDGRWVTIVDSQFPHEKQGLEAVKQKLPEAEPFRAWSNFEFRDNRGRWHEVDLLVLARDKLCLIELKHDRGILTGNDHLWRRNGRAEDSPLLLGRRKAQHFKSLLEDSIRQRGGDDGRQPDPLRVGVGVPAPPRVRLRPAGSSKINLYGLDGHGNRTGLKGISKVLLAPARHDPINERGSQLIAGLMKAIGLAPRRQREVGSWIIDEQPLTDGDGWQDWPAFHQINTEDHVRIRFYTAGQGSTKADDHALKQAVTHEYNLLSRLTYDGLQAPKDLVDEPELGIGRPLRRSSPVW
jgi:Nuclease-related domain